MGWASFWAIFSQAHLLMKLFERTCENVKKRSQVKKNRGPGSLSRGKCYNHYFGRGLGRKNKQLWAKFSE
jgi:hypothetical protein